MTSPSFDEIEPDSLTGAVFAIEGVRDAAVLLNGPTGCKFYHGAISERQIPRATLLDPLQYREEFYFGQARVPATYLDGDDYVFGSTEKLRRILPAVAAHGHSLIAVINSPGAALIGDDLERFIIEADLSIPCVSIENPGYSGDIQEGFQEATVRLLQRLAPAPRPVQPQTINLIGLSIYHKYWEGSLAALRVLLDACGISIGTTLCAGCDAAELANLRAAAANVVIHEEYAARLAPWLEQEYGMPTILPEMGAPVGFTATESWVKEICAAVQTDPSPGLEILHAARRRSYQHLSRFHSLTGLPRGATFALQADASLALPLTRWLYEYLGMIPSAVKLKGKTPRLEQALHDFLQPIKCADAAGRSIDDVKADVVLGSGATILRQRVARRDFVGISLSLPDDASLEFIPQPLLGAEGSMHLLDQIVNGLYRIC